ncbi:hypothetical protein BKA67DRAFT_664901 [Truncatella angustata]|uniref:Apple domain-containing protein n=1 Tax=Truncatella angustata TaxID=152316 RepID=A0A9P8RIP2_9PEZI|nr:uncharacterized protein BKA67DRAFT_664901 [Truncatella angustata]KAH6645058.1 hypothetical protein BKA67DRAFT_664901 [Truncatella angustata]KAH8198424.1 hypothetical protein TruAng_007408 [Truncatella angustata]
MQFTLSTIALVASLMSSQAAAKPVFFARDQTCGTTPTGTGSAQPLSSPQASTAENCKEACEEAKNCQSFAFGLPANTKAPICKLYSVSAAQVPSQDTNVVVFDLTCNNVPTQAPTSGNPVGLLRLRRSQTCGVTPSYSGSTTALSTPSASTAEDCQSAGEAVSSCQSFAFGLPKDASYPICRLFSVGASQVPAQESLIEVFDIGCSDVPNTEPTQSNPVGLVDESATTSTQKSSTNVATTTNNKETSSTQNTASNDNSNMCGAIPSGTTSNSVSPLQTNTAITSADACLTLCQATSGCKAVEFGKTSANGANQCLLFSVAASELPTPTSGQSLVVYDAAC